MRNIRLVMSAERKYITVMLCDLVNSSGLSQIPDPEEYRDLLWEYHKSSAEAIDNFDGYIAQHCKRKS